MSRAREIMRQIRNLEAELKAEEEKERVIKEQQELAKKASEAKKLCSQCEVMRPESDVVECCATGHLICVKCKIGGSHCLLCRGFICSNPRHRVTETFQGYFPDDFCIKCNRNRPNECYEALRYHLD